MALAFGLALAHSQQVFAWGPDGHRIVGEIAQKRLLPKAKQKLRREFNIESLANIANWADRVKKERSQRSWHYTNIEAGKRTYRANRDCPRGECVTEKIREFMAVLLNKKTPANEKKEALKYLVHFVGDAHQPLHLGNARDRGGNEVTVFFQGRRTNLHALWDGGLIQKEGKSLAEYARRLKCAIDPKEDFSPSHLPIAQWAGESRKLALDYAYPVTLGPKGGLAPEYIRVGRGIVEHQLCRAGTRLARLLNQALSSF